MKGNFHARFLGGCGRVNRLHLPGRLSVEIFLFIAFFAILVGAGVGWLSRGHLLFTILVCSGLAFLGQALVICCAGPPIEHFTMHYLAGYTLYLIGPFLLFYLFPCAGAGALVCLLAGRKSARHEIPEV